MGNRHPVRGGETTHGEGPPVPAEAEESLVYHFIWLNKEPVRGGRSLIGPGQLKLLKRWVEETSVPQIILWVDSVDAEDADGSMTATRAAVPESVAIMDARTIDEYR